VRHFFLGGSEEGLNDLLREVGTLAPGVCIAGAYSPPFGSRTADEIAAQDRLIKEASPDIVWVGLGTPKQDFEAARLADELRLNVAAVGAAFDFTSGAKSVAPRFIRRFWLEWLHRLMTEPRRLLWRYAWGNTWFLITAARSIGRARRKHASFPWGVAAQPTALSSEEDSYNR
jgi:N-acetylglucosaminyldiphosphoundecaprenol N-acetyl-beta-D-mannosaminyltransferase